MKCIKSLKKILVLVLVFIFVFSVIKIGNALSSEPLFKLTDAKISEKNDGVKADIISFNDNNVEINAEFHKLNDYVIYELTIKNTTNKDYTIKSITDNNDNRYVSYLYDNYQGVEIKANNSISITIKSVYQNELSDVTKRSQDNALKLSLVLVDEEGNIAGEDIYVNPKTNDNVIVFIFIGGLSLIILLGLVFIENKKTRKYFVLLICLTPVIAKAVNPSIIITINNEVKLLDKVVQTTDILGEKTTNILPYGSKISKPSDPVKDGYTFVGWYNGDEEFDFDKEYNDDFALTAKFNLISYNITYDLDGGVETTNPDTYNIESDDIVLNIPTKEDYNFAGWTGSNGTELQTRVTINKGSTGDKNYVAHFSIIDDATYYVIHQYKNLDGTYDVYIETLTGVAKTNVYPAIRPQTGFVNPEVQMLTIKGNGTASITYTYDRVPVTLSYANEDKIDLVVSSAATTYDYGSLITVKSKDIDGLEFVKWSDGSTDKTHTFNIISDTTIYPEFKTKEYKVSFNSNGGSNVANMYVQHGSELGTFPSNPVNGDLAFVGWFKDENLTIKGSTSDVITSEVTYYAKWVANITTATVSPSSIDLYLDGTQQIIISSVEEIENYSINVEDASIVSIDSSNLVTANSTGSTNIIITGESSGKTVTIPVTVSTEQVTVTYNYNDGISTATVDTIDKGSSVSSIPSPVRDTYYFDGWHIGSVDGELFTASSLVNSNITVYAKWVPNIKQAMVTPSTLELTVNETGLDSASLSINAPLGMEEYTISSSDNSIATVTSEGLVTAVSAGNVTIVYEGKLSHETIEISVVVNPEIIRHTISFIAPGYTVNPIVVIDGESIDQSDITELTKNNSFFRGWFTEENGTGDKLTNSVVFNSDVTYYAYFENIVCKAASSLRETSCSSKSGKGCLADGYSSGEKVSFGSYVSNGVLAAGDAFDCDVNGDGIYDPDKERFYYLRTDSSNNAVLVYSYNTVKQDGVIITDSDASAAFGSSYTNPNKNNLPTTTDWSNTTLKNPEHQIVNVSGTELSATVDYTGYAARLMVYDDIQSNVCFKTSAYNVKNSNCTYIFDNTGYIVDTYRSYWLEVPSGSNVLRAGGSDRYFSNVAASNTTGSGVRPVIEVPLTKLDLEIHPTYMITLEPNGGNISTNVIVVNAGDPLTDLVVPIKDGYNFDGWFIEGTNTLVTNTTIPEDNMVLVARWSYASSDEIVDFRTTNDAMITYYTYIDSWKDSSTNFPSWSSSNKSPNWALDSTENTPMMQNFVANNCECNDNQCSTDGTNKCDKPKGYDTGFSESITVRLSDESTKTKTGEIVSYAYASNGVIYNLIPGEVYYWELDSDSTIYGYVRFNSERRILEAGDVRNVRDLGGLPVDSDGNGSIDGHIAYGRLFRGTRLASSDSVTYLSDLGVNYELDLRESNSDNSMSNYTRVEAQNYYVNPYNYETNPNSTTQTEYNYYLMTRSAVKKAMELIVNDDDTNVFFHCRIGTDRTGTVAWVLEGLLGVPEENRIEDFELSFFYGLVRIHRYHNEKPGSNVGTGKERFTYMHNFMPTNADIYSWYMYGSDNQQADENLINAFRNKMIIND